MIEALNHYRRLNTELMIILGFKTKKQLRKWDKKNKKTYREKMDMCVDFYNGR